MSVKCITPSLSRSQVFEMMRRLFRLTASEIHSLPSYEDQNLHVSVLEGGEYVLKIMNSEDSKNPAMIEVQTCAMSLLHQHGLPAQTALPTTSGQLMSLEEIDCGHGCQKYLVRLLTYLPGATISKAPLTPQLLYETGKTAARMDKILQQMEHPQLGMLQREKFTWSLSNVPMLETYISVLDGDPLQEVVKSVSTRPLWSPNALISANVVVLCSAPSVDDILDYKVPRILNGTRANLVEKGPHCLHVYCINHGDFNDLNVLVQPDESGSYRISGIIDFADMNSGYYVYELAIAIMHMMMQHPQPIEVGGAVLAGWESVLPLNKAERDCLYMLVLSRFCQFLVLTRHAVSLRPDNAEYFMRPSRNDVHFLQELWDMGKERVEEVWFQSADQFRDGNSHGAFCPH